jgi:hypothetical protein
MKRLLFIVLSSNRYVRILRIHISFTPPMVHLRVMSQQLYSPAVTADKIDVNNKTNVFLAFMADYDVYL